MRVVHVLKVTAIAGAERHLLTLLAGLRAAELDARLLIFVRPDKPMDDFVQAATERGIPAERLPIYTHTDPTLHYRLCRRLRELRPDLVHTHLQHGDLYGIPAARLARVPLVVTTRHNDNAFRRRAPLRLLNRILWRMADAGIAISDSLARFSIEVEGAAPAKVRRVYYGLESAPPLDRRAARLALRMELDLPTESVLVGMACRLVEQKGVIYGLRAFERVADRFPDAHLIIAGDGPLRERLAAEALALNAGHRVHFLGWRDDAAQVLAALDVFLMPSLWEGFGLVLLEAMAQQTPVIATAVSAIPEVIADGESGRLVPPRDADALAAALGELLADEALRKHLGLLGQERQESQFTAAQMVAETIAIYRRLREGK